VWIRGRRGVVGVSTLRVGVGIRRRETRGCLRDEVCVDICMRIHPSRDAVTFR
jgi:hypothetical protein